MLERFLKWSYKLFISALAGAYLVIVWKVNTDHKLVQFSKDVVEIRSAQAALRQDRENMYLDLTRSMGSMELRIIEKINQSNNQINGRILLLEEAVEKKIPQN